MLPWNEKVVSFQINPESATMADIVRMAEELVEAKKEPIKEVKVKK
jgi:hypothetical protein